MSRPKLPIMLDIETISLRPNAAIIDIAFKPATDDGILRQWYINPDSYTDNFEFDVDSETIKFHESQKTGIMRTATTYGVHWGRATEEINSYLKNLGNSYEIHLWSRGKDADIPWLNNLFHQAGYKTPWKYSHTHCLRDLGDLYSHVHRTSFGNHTAARDVEAQCKHLQDIAATSDMAYRFIYGY